MKIRSRSGTGVLAMLVNLTSAVIFPAYLLRGNRCRWKTQHLSWWQRRASRCDADRRRSPATYIARWAPSWRSPRVEMNALMHTDWPRAVRAFWKAQLFGGGLLCIGACGSGAHAEPLTLSGNQRWIVLASRQAQEEAIGVALAHRFSFRNLRVVESANGWFAVVAGPEAVSDIRARKETLVQRGAPRDMIFSRGEAYRTTVWTPQAPKYDCPSSDNLRPFLFLRNGGSGSSGFEVMRPAADAASVSPGWSGA